MRIGFVSPYDLSRGGGVNHHIETLARHFSNNGHTTRIIAPVSNGDNLNENIIATDTHPLRLAAGGSYAHISLRSPFQRKKIGEILKQFDILHVHEPFMFFLPLVAIEESRIPTIATFHAAKDRGNVWYWVFRNMPLTGDRMERAMERLDHKICVSRQAKRLISRYFPPPDYGYDIIPNPIDVERFSSAEPFEDLKDGKVNIVYVGRLEKRKGIEYLLHAYGNIAHCSNVRLVIVSSGGNLRYVCDRIIDARGLENVVFANNVSNEDLPRYYKSADVVCAPSIMNESFGYVLVEGMAAGKPIIASRIPGYEDVIKDGQGVLVKPRDIDELTQTLYQVVKDEDWRKHMGEVGRTTVEQYSTPVIAEKVEKVYEEVLNR